MAFLRPPIQSTTGHHGPFLSDPIFFLTDPSVAVDPPPSSLPPRGAEVLHLIGLRTDHRVGDAIWVGSGEGHFKTRKGRDGN